MQPSQAPQPTCGYLAPAIEVPSRFRTVGYISCQKSGRGRYVMRRRRQFSPEFKEEAVRMVLEGERTVASVAREFGINASTRPATPTKCTSWREDPSGLSSVVRRAQRHG
jgi:hypothetical protein